jgi:hypothetical protein
MHGQYCDSRVSNDIAWPYMLFQRTLLWPVSCRLYYAYNVAGSHDLSSIMTIVYQSCSILIFLWRLLMLECNDVNLGFKLAGDGSPFWKSWIKNFCSVYYQGWRLWQPNLASSKKVTLISPASTDGSSNWCCSFFWNLMHSFYSYCISWHVSQGHVVPWQVSQFWAAP